jgi:hypothetical protein
MPRVQSQIQGIKGVAAGADADSDTVRCLLCRAVHALVKFKAQQTQIVEFGYLTTFDLGLYTSFHDTIEQSVDVRLLGEVHVCLLARGLLKLF